mmetsp:Transcript_33344/g.77983  ORF Transcript_33344/g.77983 Transcript_33344/m.77983 type:complete len:273 (+) Transcript_33344:180-998(+)
MRGRYQTEHSGWSCQTASSTSWLQFRGSSSSHSSRSLVRAISWSCGFGGSLLVGAGLCLCHCWTLRSSISCTEGARCRDIRFNGDPSRQSSHRFRSCSSRFHRCSSSCSRSSRSYNCSSTCSNSSRGRLSKVSFSPSLASSTCSHSSKPHHSSCNNSKCHSISPCRRLNSSCSSSQCSRSSKHCRFRSSHSSSNLCNNSSSPRFLPCCCISSSLCNSIPRWCSSKTRSLHISWKPMLRLPSSLLGLLRHRSMCKCVSLSRSSHHPTRLMHSG